MSYLVHAALYNAAKTLTTLIFKNITVKMPDIQNAVG